ncbi:MAG TPA: T9SS type A sorting domain-containing protein, partial [Flavobacteriales bacterium]|nr:T9SS type A sorting domain-containing protein [Flavobacteriales bacterium]
KVYPNPTTGSVRVDGLDVRRGVRVLDALGHVVRVPIARVSTTSVDVDLSGQPTGVYQVVTDEGRAVGRVVKQ